MLILPIKRKWFDMIKSGEKKEEYREIKPYWTKRFENYYEIAKLNIELECPNFKEIYYRVVFRNGYGNNAPRMTCVCKLRVGQGKEEWGAEKGKEYYVLEILKIVGGEDEEFARACAYEGEDSGMCLYIPKECFERVKE